MPAEPITFFSRQTQQIETEAVYGEAFLRFTYESVPGQLPLHALVKRAAFSRWYGSRMDAPASQAKVAPFLATYGVDTSEFADPPASFRTFNEFFYRRLKPTARPIVAAENAIALPADGRHLVLPDVAACDSFFIKGVRFDLGALLADAGLAERYAHGSLLISRLCPVDYHRFHFPCAGTPGPARLMNGPLYSVSPIALRKRPSILWENKREITVLSTPNLGNVVLLEIGATCVGSIVQTYTPGAAVSKGAEKGYFRFGGSCFITLFEPGKIRFDDDLVEHSRAGREVYARMGELAGLAV